MVAILQLSRFWRFFQISHAFFEVTHLEGEEKEHMDRLLDEDGAHKDFSSRVKENFHDIGRSITHFMSSGRSQYTRVSVNCSCLAHCSKDV